MVFQPVPNTAKFDCIFAVNHTERAQFSVYSNNDAAPWEATQLTDIATAISDAIVADYLPALSVDHDFVGVIGRDLEVEFGRVEEVLLPAVEPGTLASPSLPGNVAVCATFKSATGAPRRGRIFMLPPAESQVTKDLLELAAQAALQDAAQAISDAASLGVGYSHVIVSRFSGKTLQPADEDGVVIFKPTPRAEGVVANVASVEVKRRTDSMRSRLSRETS